MGFTGCVLELIDVFVVETVFTVRVLELSDAFEGACKLVRRTLSSCPSASSSSFMS